MAEGLFVGFEDILCLRNVEGNWRWSECGMCRMVSAWVETGGRWPRLLTIRSLVRDGAML